MKIMSNKQYEAEIDEALMNGHIAARNQFETKIKHMIDALPKSSITKRNILGAILGLDPAQPKTRVTPEVEAPRETAINHAALKDRVGGA